MQHTILLLSIKPKYAKQIFEYQTKKVELRRVRTRLREGDIVIVYVSSPQKIFVGSFEVDCVIQEKASVQEIKNFWHLVKDQAGIERKEFYSYYRGASLVVGIFFRNVQAFSQPVELERLQKKLSYLRPPQSYRYLNDKEYEIIKALGEDKITLMVDQ
jgi:predicted transcriptional regulator